MVQRCTAPERCADARGFLLMEHAVSMSICLLLLSFLAFALVWSWRSYQDEVADAELRQEMQMAAARIVESALLSDRIGQRQRGIFEMRQRPSGAQCGDISHYRLVWRGGRPYRGVLRTRGCAAPASLSHRDAGRECGDGAKL